MLQRILLIATHVQMMVSLRFFLHLFYHYSRLCYRDFIWIGLRYECEGLKDASVPCNLCAQTTTWDDHRDEFAGLHAYYPRAVAPPNLRPRSRESHFRSWVSFNDDAAYKLYQ